MPQVIEWRGAGPDDIVWRYPVEEITNAAQLVVHEYELAVFLKDGKAYDVFPAGRHTHNSEPAADNLGIPNLLRRQDTLYSHRHLRLYQTVRRQVGRKGSDY